MYSLTKLPKQNRLELSFSGHMEQDPAAFFAELTNAAKAVRANDGTWSLLVDFSDTPVMPQDRAQNTAKIYDWCIANGVKRIAFVMQSVTQKMQIKRVSGRSEIVQAFDTKAQAEAWLRMGAVAG